MNRLGARSLLAELPIHSVDEIVERIDAVDRRGSARAHARELFHPRPKRFSAAAVGAEEDAFLHALAAALQVAA